MKKYKPSQFSSSTKKTHRSSSKKSIHIIKPDSAGIDIGSRSHFVAIPEDCTEQHVREFSSTTAGLLEMAKWLKQYGIQTIAMESTGSYWIPVYEILECQGFEVYLVNARSIKNVPGRKTDVLDCQWIQKLHSFGLLSKSFRPKQSGLKLRALTRQHSSLIEHRSPHVLHMQKALIEMNIQLSTHIRDITGVTGMRIINAIINGERDINVFASLVHPRCKHSAEKIAESLKGHYLLEHLFALKQSRDLYLYYTEKISECEQEIKKALEELLPHTKSGKQSEVVVESTAYKATRKQKRKSPISFSAAPMLTGIIGIDLTEIPGIEQATALKIMAELGGNVDAWKSAKHFASWLGLCPGNKISGGKQISGKTKSCVNKVAQLLRMAANSLWHTKCYLGAFLRRMKARLGGMKAITATAHKFAVIIYTVIANKMSYKELGEEFYEKTYYNRRLKGLERQAKEMGFELHACEVN